MRVSGIGCPCLYSIQRGRILGGENVTFLGCRSFCAPLFEVSYFIKKYTPIKWHFWDPLPVNSSDMTMWMMRPPWLKVLNKKRRFYLSERTKDSILANETLDPGALEGHKASIMIPSKTETWLKNDHIFGTLFQSRSSDRLFSP